MKNQRSSTKWVGWLIIIIPTMLVVGMIVLSATRPRPGEEVQNQGNRHLTSLAETHEPYNSKPPTSGPHRGNKAPWGISDTQIPDEIQVHNLEDGGVIIHYNKTQATTTTIQQLKNIIQPYYLKSKNIILEPYADMDSPIALTAWTRIERLQTVDKEKIEQFIKAYIGIDHH